MRRKVSAINDILDIEMDIPVRKIKYALRVGYLKGLYLKLGRCGIELNDDTFKIFRNILNRKLSGSSKIEYEWTEDEYKALMEIKGVEKKEEL